jgi:hypothetical protein
MVFKAPMPSSCRVTTMAENITKNNTERMSYSLLGISLQNKQLKAE